MKKTASLIFASLILLLCLFGCNATEQLKEKLNARITRGTINGNVYQSDFTGITFTKPDHWRYLTDEEIAEAVNIGKEALEVNAFENTVLEYSSVYDMAVINEKTAQNLIVGYENISLTFGKSISEEEYYEFLKEGLEGSGFESTNEMEYVLLSGEDYLKVSFLGVSNGVEIENTSYLRLVGDIMTFITVTTPVGLINRNIEGMFS
ncbi:MAG: hypothetical protein IJA62_02840 [Ruminococcus sp.]|nr:hypothetical protein [Ruminococcus sp.]